MNIPSGQTSGMCITTAYVHWRLIQKRYKHVEPTPLGLLHARASSRDSHPCHQSLPGAGDETAPPTPIQPSGTTQRDQRPNKGASSLLKVYTSYRVVALGPVQAVALGSTSGRANCSRQEKTYMQAAVIPLGSSSSLLRSLVQEVSNPHRNSSWALPFEILRGGGWRVD